MSDTTPVPENRRGPLSQQEKLFIEQNAATMKIADIAASLLRNENSIKTYITENKLFSEETFVRNEEDTELVNHLHSLDWWQSIRDQFSEKELGFFENFWVRLFRQFDYDVLPSEEIQMRKFITLEIMKDRTQKQIRGNELIIEVLDEKYRKELAVDKDQRDKLVIMDLREQLSSLKSASPHLNKEFLDLCKEQESLARGLSASRNDRIKNIQDATKNWTSVLKLLEDSGVRREVGKYMEVMRVARDKELGRLVQYHKFVDGDYDKPILSGRLESELDESENENSDN